MHKHFQMILVKIDTCHIYIYTYILELDGLVWGDNTLLCDSKPIPDEDYN